ncbi:hypothetical protein MAM1_0028d02273 [Mucor ambiguus]|uniref:Uncharacterized protein n=1 Tax=Mucor ambiguus TaxID=91626 RepID=A0A0C9M2C0_9FUNG|nr:hypothetical protein MAM1_0028d02273 [Mucor ambiguus]
MSPTERFNKTTALGLNQWLRDKIVNFENFINFENFVSFENFANFGNFYKFENFVNFNSEDFNFANAENSVELQSSFVLKRCGNQLYGEVADSIVCTIPRHHEYIKQLKDDDYQVIKYYRKSEKASEI